MEQRIPTTIEPTKQPERVEAQTSPMSLDGKYSASMAALGGFFGIHDGTSEEENQMRFIEGFFLDRGIKEMAGMLMNIREIENRLGTIPLHLSRLGAIYQYLKTQSAIDSLGAEKRSMERNV